MASSDPLPGQLPGTGVYINDPDDLPGQPGCYILDIRLDADLALVRPSRFLNGPNSWPATLPAGHYFYCGSASGPGGLRARVGRHFRKSKAVRWHIDRLTVGGTLTGALVFAKPEHSGISECMLAAALVAGPVFADVALAGFGSSDCRHCPGHLFGQNHSLHQLFG